MFQTHATFHWRRLSRLSEQLTGGTYHHRQDDAAVHVIAASAAACQEWCVLQGPKHQALA